MDDNYKYSIEELLSEAKNDPSWEPDDKKREALVKQLKEILERI